MPDSTTIIALPHAGGAAFNYHALRKVLPLAANLVAVDLPGHGSRIGEPLLTSIPDIAKDVIEQHRSHMQDNYILFGHSMGAMLGYEICSQIASIGLNMPDRLVASGRQSPVVRETERYTELPRQDFIKLITSLGGVPTELIEHPELFSLFESILYADFKAIETYDPSLEHKLQLPITVIAGRDDEILTSRLELWAEVTSAETEIHLFPGGHFYLYDNLHEVASILLNCIPNTESIPVAA